MVELSEMNLKPLSQKYVNAGISMTVSMLETIDRLRDLTFVAVGMSRNYWKEELEKHG
jgi:hypothetical protein